MDNKEKPGLIMCVCNGKCPGFEKMDIWEFINIARMDLPVEYGFIHPELCKGDGDRFFADFLKSKRKVIVAGCDPETQYRLLSDAFAGAGLEAKEKLVPLDIRDMTTEEALEEVKRALREMGLLEVE